MRKEKKYLGVGAWWKGRPQLSGIDLLHENKSENGFPFRHWQGLSFNGLVMYFRVHCEKKIMRCQLWSLHQNTAIVECRARQQKLCSQFT